MRILATIAIAVNAGELSLPLTLVVSLCSACFGAGGVYFLIKQSRKDVNGLGRKLGAEVKSSNDRFTRLERGILLVARDDAQRERLAEMLSAPLTE
jgi:hypothetical protein